MGRATAAPTAERSRRGSGVAPRLDLLRRPARERFLKPLPLRLRAGERPGQLAHLRLHHAQRRHALAREALGDAQLLRLA